MLVQSLQKYFRVFRLSPKGCVFILCVCLAKANTAKVSDLRVTTFTFCLIRCDRMGLARPVQQQMFCSNVTPGLPNTPSGSACVFGADLAQVLANWEQQGSM